MQACLRTSLETLESATGPSDPPPRSDPPRVWTQLQPGCRHRALHRSRLHQAARVRASAAAGLTSGVSMYVALLSFTPGPLPRARSRAVVLLIAIRHVRQQRRPGRAEARAASTRLPGRARHAAVLGLLLYFVLSPVSAAALADFAGAMKDSHVAVLRRGAHRPMLIALVVRSHRTRSLQAQAGCRALSQHASLPIDLDAADARGDTVGQAPGHRPPALPDLGRDGSTNNSALRRAAAADLGWPMQLSYITSSGVA